MFTICGTSLGRSAFRRFRQPALGAAFSAFVHLQLDLARIYRKTALGTLIEEARGSSSVWLVLYIRMFSTYRSLSHPHEHINPT